MKGHQNEDTGTACCIEGCREFLRKKCSVSLKQRNYFSDQGQPVFGELEEEITKICSMILASHKKQIRKSCIVPVWPFVSAVFKWLRKICICFTKSFPPYS